MAEEFSWSICDPPGLSRLPDTLTGRVIADKFLLEALIGRGGMGRVYRGRDLSSGREVAVKLLHGIPTPVQLERFRREGELSARLDHPGIVRVHAGGTWQELPFLVYELIESGQELGGALRSAPRPRVIQLVLETARALGYAHSHGVVHRDVKPQNVLVDAHGRVRVTDFGVAAATWLPSLTQTGGLVGTPAYMAPEQFRSSDETGPPSDVWALGVILYRALTGTHPFPAHTLLEQEARVQRGRPRSPRELVPDISPALEATCLRALASSPADRYPDAGALADALETALRSEVTARRPSWVRTALGAVVVLSLVASLLQRHARSTPIETERPAPLGSSSRRGPPLDAVLLLGLARGEPLAAVAPRAGPSLEAAVATLGAVPIPAATSTALTGGPPNLRIAASAWLLAQVERDLAFLERGPFVAAAELASEVRRARIEYRLTLAGLLSDGSQVDADRAKARLLPTGSPVRAACLERLRSVAPTDPWGALLSAEDALARGEAREALTALNRAGQCRRSAWIRRGLFVRVRALLLLGKTAEALAALAAAPDPRDPERLALEVEALERAGRDEEAVRSRDRLSRLLGAKRAEAHQIVIAGMRAARAGREDPEALGVELERAAELDPGSPFASYYASQARYALGNREEPLANLARAVTGAPWLLHELQATLMTLFHARRTVSLPLEPVLEGCAGTGEDERLARGFVLCGLIEFEGRADLAGQALVLLDGLLEEDPSLLPAWTLRAFLHIRGGRLDHAARDLEVSREVDPACPSLLLYQALLLAARRAPREEVREALLCAHEHGYQLWSRRRELAGWRIDSYPEVARYAGILREVQDRAPNARVRNLPARW